VNERRFVAMGTEVVVGAREPMAFGAVEQLFREREATFSRFIADSELNRVNACAGRMVRTSTVFADALSLALRLADETGGLLDPTLGVALEAAGYSRDFETLRPDPAPPARARPGVWRTVRIIGRCVFVAPGVRLDLNGVVKALAVDDALALFAGDGFVSAGGDLAVRGELNVSVPNGQTVLLRRGALATSGSVKRRWLRGGAVQHHLIDPRTGRPSASRWEQVTVCGATCVAADAAAKAAFLLDGRGPTWLDSRGIPGLFFGVDGSVIANATWERSIAEAVPCT
jgi:thiamine biosynthesis lipoprotein